MLSGMSNLSPNVNGKVQVCSVQEAIRLGADAVSVHVNIGAQDEDKMLQNLGSVADECDVYGMPLLAMMYPRGPKIQNEHAADVVAHAARIGAELGADIIKANFTGSIETIQNRGGELPSSSGDCRRTKMQDFRRSSPNHPRRPFSWCIWAFYRTQRLST